MRYLVLAGVSAVSMIMTACISPHLSIVNAQMDVMLAAMLCMVLREKTLTPVFYTAGMAVLMDAFFSRAFGFYTLQYLGTGLVIYLVMRTRRIDTAAVMASGAGFWLLREILGVWLCFLSDRPVGMSSRFVYSVLPGCIPQVLLCLIVHWLMGKLYAHRFVWPIGLYSDHN
ncbi:MAG: hypothetical protein IKM60_00810 [Clostridia bacterium]|nr:hypothetical protein [Clostridia bacterium]